MRSHRGAATAPSAEYSPALDLGPQSKVYLVRMVLKVSELASRAGVSADTIRFYEREGLIASPKRTSSGYRQFDEGVVRRVRFIKGGRSLGLKLAEIRELLEVQDRGACPCGHTRTLVDRRLAEIDAEMKELQRLRSELESLQELECLSSGQSSMDAWPCEVELVKRGGD